MKLKDLFRDSTYDNRCLRNAPDVIATLNQMGVNNKQIGEECGVSPPMVTRWSKEHYKDLPTYEKIDPLLVKMGIGRFDTDYEPVNKAARQYKPIEQFLMLTCLYGGLLTLVWFISIKPCRDNWDECQKLSWYEMGAYQMKKNAEKMEEMSRLYREHKASQNQH